MLTRFMDLRVAVVLCLFGGTLVQAEVRPYERQIIASVLVLEAACQGEEGMLAVLHV